MSTETNYDDLLYPILCGEGNIFGFFDKIFEFLYRRTDFFKLKTEDSPDLGLADGEAERIVKSVFCKYMESAVSERKSQEMFEVDPILLDYIAEETVVTTESDSEKISPPPEESTVELQENKIRSKRKEDQSDPKIPMMDPDSYNGASYDDYSWSQTIRDIDIHVKVPSEVTSGKQVHVDIQQTHIRVELIKGEELCVLKEGDLSWKVNVEESAWTLIPGEILTICLHKMKERWWDSCFIDGPKINLKAIDPSIPFEDLDQESQAKIEELMYNEHLKRLGKPTIKQTKIHNILKDAWDRDGSPFKGQPFDPSAVDVQNTESALL
ncbi:nudC domain-containing protein 3 [Trichonephila inaurata madagascariensis]|uniref:NudC domain-containing protein 3 n=1 Tax=Trichonephila inaurata madagascariensis TaxID=2747483 RepID=A0A8X6ILS6_9ARAC|nr:nudC domain-containing protein 3 [Trichonephila inaurata madagascariensis]